MKLRIEKCDYDTRIALVLRNDFESVVIRRWPWPKDGSINRKHLSAALRLGNAIARVLKADLEIAK